MIPLMFSSIVSRCLPKAKKAIRAGHSEEEEGSTGTSRNILASEWELTTYEARCSITPRPMFAARRHWYTDGETLNNCSSLVWHSPTSHDAGHGGHVASGLMLGCASPAIMSVVSAAPFPSSPDTQA